MITDRGMKELGRLVKLEVVDLSDTMIGDKGAEFLLELDALSYIDLSGTFVTPAFIEKLRKRFKKLNCVYSYPPKMEGV